VFVGIEEEMEPDTLPGTWMPAVAQVLEQQQRVTERLVMEQANIVRQQQVYI